MSINRVVHWVSYLPEAGKGSAVCSSLHCGTRYLIAVLARPTAQVPRWAGNVSGGEGAGSIPGRFLAYWCTLLQALLDRALALRLS